MDLLETDPKRWNAVAHVSSRCALHLVSTRLVLETRRSRLPVEAMMYETHLARSTALADPHRPADRTESGQPTAGILVLLTSKRGSDAKRAPGGSNLERRILATPRGSTAVVFQKQIQMRSAWRG